MDGADGRRTPRRRARAGQTRIGACASDGLLSRRSAVLRTADRSDRRLRRGLRSGIRGTDRPTGRDPQPIPRSESRPRMVTGRTLARVFIARRVRELWPGAPSGHSPRPRSWGRDRPLAAARAHRASSVVSGQQRPTALRKRCKGTGGIVHDGSRRRRGAAGRRRARRGLPGYRRGLGRRQPFNLLRPEGGAGRIDYSLP